MAEIRRLRKAPIGAAELKRAKDFIVGQIKLGLESTSRQMLWVGENLVALDRFVSPEEVVAGVNSVSSGDVMKLAVEVLTPGRASFAYVGPEGVIGGEKQAAALLAAIE
jgi:predicted Zn-dependent peptidase